MPRGGHDIGFFGLFSSGSFFKLNLFRMPNFEVGKPRGHCSRQNKCRLLDCSATRHLMQPKPPQSGEATCAILTQVSDVTPIDPRSELSIARPANRQTTASTSQTQSLAHLAIRSALEPQLMALDEEDWISGLSMKSPSRRLT